MIISLDPFQPSILGLFDLVLIVFIIRIDNWLIRTKRLRCINWKVILARLILFGFILPFGAMIVEWKLVSVRHNFTDSHETLYAFIRFPIYWTLGFLELVVLYFFFWNREYLNK